MPRELSIRIRRRSCSHTVTCRPSGETCMLTPCMRDRTWLMVPERRALGSSDPDSGPGSPRVLPSDILKTCSQSRGSRAVGPRHRPPTHPCGRGGSYLAKGAGERVRIEGKGDGAAGRGGAVGEAQAPHGARLPEEEQAQAHRKKGGAPSHPVVPRVGAPGTYIRREGWRGRARRGAARRGRRPPCQHCPQGRVPRCSASPGSRARYRRALRRRPSCSRWRTARSGSSSPT